MDAEMDDGTVSHVLERSQISHSLRLELVMLAAGRG